LDNERLTLLLTDLEREAATFLALKEVSALRRSFRSTTTSLWALEVLTLDADLETDFLG